MGRTIPLLALALLAGSLTPAAAQSFDCSKATAPDEVAVCNSGYLSALDDELSGLYQDVLAHALMGVAGETRDAQRTFLEQRASCGSNADCIGALYANRIEALKDARTALGPGSGAN